MAFELDPMLAADTRHAADLPLCELRLMDDARYPWLVLVPRVAGAVEILDLDAGDQRRLFDEMRTCARALQAHTGAHKLNIAALGNVVRQLHVHVLARDEGDAAWPGPVWGSGAPRRHDEAAKLALVARLRDHLGPIAAHRGAP